MQTPPRAASKYGNQPSPCELPTGKGEAAIRTQFARMSAIVKLCRTVSVFFLLGGRASGFDSKYGVTNPRKRKKHSFQSAFLGLVTRTGIEPMLQP